MAPILSACFLVRHRALASQGAVLLMLLMVIAMYTDVFQRTCFAWSEHAGHGLLKLAPHPFFAKVRLSAIALAGCRIDVLIIKF